MTHLIVCHVIDVSQVLHLLHIKWEKKVQKDNAPSHFFSSQQRHIASHLHMTDNRIHISLLNTLSQAYKRKMKLVISIWKYSNKWFHKTAASKLNIYLPSIHQFLKNKTDITYESSTIHYLNIISENADSDSTLLKVSEDLIDAFQGGTQQDWILLAGDGKTYQHLTKIKIHMVSPLKNC